MTRPSHGLRQEFATKQQMLLLPQMLQSLELLELPATELESWLEAQAESNEALLVRTPRQAGGMRESSERHEGWLDQQPDRAASLSERVEQELALRDLSPLRAAWVRWPSSRSPFT